MEALKDFFSLLLLPQSFEVDEAALEDAYFAMQRQYHPDRFARRSPEERQAATQMSVRVNDAYQTLRFPLTRAQYLLQLHGIKINTGDDGVKPDTATLMESMEMQEALAEVKNEADIDVLANHVAVTETECLKGLRNAFAASDFMQAAQLALRFSYLTKLTENIRQKRFALASSAA